jgi:hypothetical protein
MALTYQRIKQEQFAFRVMKEVKSFVKNGGRLEDARQGILIALASLYSVSEGDLKDALRSGGYMDTRPPSGHGRPGSE